MYILTVFVLEENVAQRVAFCFTLNSTICPFKLTSVLLCVLNLWSQSLKICCLVPPQGIPSDSSEGGHQPHLALGCVTWEQRGVHRAFVCWTVLQVCTFSNCANPSSECLFRTRKCHLSDIISSCRQESSSGEASCFEVRGTVTSDAPWFKPTRYRMVFIDLWWLLPLLRSLNIKQRIGSKTKCHCLMTCPNLLNQEMVKLNDFMSKETPASCK